MQVKVNYLAGMKYEAIARGHRIVSDQPVDAGGTDAGMTPPELLLASLGTCAMYYAANYLRFQNLSAEGMTVSVDAGKAANPARLDNFRISIGLPAHIDARHQDGARRSAEKCLVKNTLLYAPAIEVTIGAAEAVA